MVRIGMGARDEVQVARDPHEVLSVRPGADWKSIRLAYLALARRYHPDGSSPDGPRMAEINAAYETLERTYGTVVAGGDQPPASPPQPEPTPGGPARGSLLWRMQTTRDDESPVLDFGPYAGKRIAEIARLDPRYLRWLGRQSSGIPYRRAIEAVIGSIT
jgi:hypothetical protein